MPVYAIGHKSFPLQSEDLRVVHDQVIQLLKAGHKELTITADGCPAFKVYRRSPGKLFMDWPGRAEEQEPFLRAAFAASA